MLSLLVPFFRFLALLSLLSFFLHFFLPSFPFYSSFLSSSFHSLHTCLSLSTPFPPCCCYFSHLPSLFFLLFLKYHPSLLYVPLRLYLRTFCYWCSFLLSLNFFFLWPSFSILLYPHLCFLLINFPSLPFLTPYCCSFLSSLPSLLCLPL